MKTVFAIGWIFVAACVLGCNRPVDRVEQEAREQKPSITPTEVFNLRTKCTELTDKWEQEGTLGATGSALQSDFVPHYDSVTNHCYVKVTVTKNFNFVYVPNKMYGPVSNNYLGIALYDVQTRQMLLNAQREGTTATGNDFRDDSKTTFSEFDKIANEINRLMREE